MLRAEVRLERGGAHHPHRLVGVDDLPLVVADPMVDAIQIVGNTWSGCEAEDGGGLYLAPTLLLIAVVLALVLRVRFVLTRENAEEPEA